MLHALKWTNLHTRMFFAPNDGGGSEAPAGGGSGGDGGGGADPAAAAPASSGGGEAAIDWSALGDAGDVNEVSVPESPVGTPSTEPPKVVPVQPQEPGQSPPPQQAPQAPPAPPPAAAQPQGQGASEAGRPLSASDPWRIAEGIEANRDAIVAHLAQSKFALSEADIKALDTDVTVAVPQLLARVFLESQVSMQKFLAQAVPGMVKQFNTVSRANDDAETKFFDMHKALDRNNPQHRATTVRIASLYRQANPGIPLDQLIREVGPMVMAALQVSGAPAHAPAARARSAPFVPAVNGGGGLNPTPAPPGEWEGLGRDYD